MDLVADMLFRHLKAEHAGEIAVEQLRPPMQHRFGHLPWIGAGGLARNADRLTNRFGDYPRWLRAQTHRFDLFHIVDHSYAQLAHVLPADRTIVTCHDLDTFRCLIDPQRDARSRLFRYMSKRTLQGFRKVAHVVSNSRTTHAELVHQEWFDTDRLSVSHLGVHSAFHATADPAPDAVVRDLVTTWPGGLYILHVGSTVPRKRIDVLLRVLASIVRDFPEVRLIKAGGALTASQWELAETLGVSRNIVAMPGVSHGILAALYRGAAALLQTSDAEGFGIPVIEALACGCPVLASDIPALREAGGAAALYCPVADPEGWADALGCLLTEQAESPEIRQRRSLVNQRHAAQFTWAATASRAVDIYRSVWNSSCRERTGKNRV